MNLMLQSDNHIMFFISYVTFFWCLFTCAFIDFWLFFNCFKLKFKIFYMWVMMFSVFIEWSHLCVNSYVVLSELKLIQR